MSSALDDALDELYGVVPEEFVLVRSRLERELKAAGQGEAAAEIHRRRRPHLAAWACNQIAREQPDAVRDLFEATASVATAQQEAMARGDGVALREATRARQELLDELTTLGLRRLARHAPKPAQYRDSIAATLDAATLDPDAAGELRAGRLTQPLLAPAGFGPWSPADLPGSPAPAARRPSAREVQKARRDVERAAADARRLADAADEADAVVASADLAAQSAVMHLAEVDQARTRARESVAETGVRLSEAKQAAQAAHLVAREAEARMQEREARLRKLEEGD
jgi:hypothetical protein